MLLFFFWIVHRSIRHMHGHPEASPVCTSVIHWFFVVCLYINHILSENAIHLQHLHIHVLSARGVPVRLPISILRLCVDVLSFATMATELWWFICSYIVGFVSSGFTSRYVLYFDWPFSTFWLMLSFMVSTNSFLISSGLS